MTPALTAHLEQYVGRIREGWDQDADGQPVPFQVVLLENSASPAHAVHATLGLSNVALRSRHSEDKIRHELVMLSRFAEAHWPVPAILQQVGLAAFETGFGYSHGDVIGPHGPLCAGSSMEALYVTSPSCFANEFATCETPIGTVVLAWLVPIGPNEAGYVRRNGWNAFEERLMQQKPDLADVRRPELVLHGG